MAMTAFSAQGTLVKVNDLAIFGRTKVTAPPVSRATLETTDLDSTWETSIPGIRRAGEMKYEINWDPGNASQAAVWGWYGNGAIGNWSTTLADTGGGLLYGDGYVTNFEPSESGTDVVQKATVTIKHTGALTLTP